MGCVRRPIVLGRGSGPHVLMRLLRRGGPRCGHRGIVLGPVRRYIRQLHHAHVTELINAGVPIEVVRCGHTSTETTQLYTLLADNVADAEIRTARRRRDRANH